MRYPNLESITKKLNFNDDNGEQEVKPKPGKALKTPSNSNKRKKIGIPKVRFEHIEAITKKRVICVADVGGYYSYKQQVNGRKKNEWFNFVDNVLQTSLKKKESAFFDVKPLKEDQKMREMREPASLKNSNDFINDFDPVVVAEPQSPKPSTFFQITATPVTRAYEVKKEKPAFSGVKALKKDQKMQTTKQPTSLKNSNDFINDSDPVVVAEPQSPNPSTSFQITATPVTRAYEVKKKKNAFSGVKALKKDQKMQTTKQPTSLKNSNDFIIDFDPVVVVEPLSPKPSTSFQIAATPVTRAYKVKKKKTAFSGVEALKKDQKIRKTKQPAPLKNINEFINDLDPVVVVERLSPKPSTSSQITATPVTRAYKVKKKETAFSGVKALKKEQKTRKTKQPESLKNINDFVNDFDPVVVAEPQSPKPSTAVQTTARPMTRAYKEFLKTKENEEICKPTTRKCQKISKKEREENIIKNKNGKSAGRKIKT